MMPIGRSITRILLALIVALLAAKPVHSAEDPLKRGMHLYKSHLYDDAGRVLHASLSTGDPAELGRIYLGLGMTYLASAQLYRAFYRASLRLQVDYLGRLVATEDKGGSRYANLFLGRALLESGKPREAVSLLKKCISDERMRPEDRALARVYLGEAYHGQGKMTEARKLWSALNSKDPGVLCCLAATYSRLGLEGTNPVALGERALGLSRRSTAGTPIGVMNNLIEIYTRDGQLEKGLALLARSDLSTFTCEEIVDENKVIQFYDPSLLSNLSTLLGKASLQYLERAATKGELKDTARYYLGEAHAEFGSVPTSNRMIDLVLATDTIPAQYKARAAAIRAVNLGPHVNEKTVQDELERMVGPKADYSSITEILSTCAALQIECPDVERRASDLAAAGERAKFADMNHALGKYYLQRKEYNKAILFLEAGRDKSNKNSISHNDPLMLINLAEAYYRTRNFSEALEIYFEMGKHFPAVRQIQAAMQGVYAREQKSAGDVKLF